MKDDRTTGAVGARTGHDEESADARRRLRLGSRAACTRLGVLFASLALLLLGVYAVCIEMPGASHTGPLPALSGAQRACAERLARDVGVLAIELEGR